MTSGGREVKHRLLLALLLVAASGYAADAPAMTPRHVALGITRSAGSGFTPADALMIVRALHQRLQEAEKNVVVVEVPELPAPAAPEQAAAAARAAGADGWLLLTLDGRWTSARLGFLGDDLLSGGTVVDFSATRPSWGSPASLAAETWTDVVRAIEGKFPMVASAPPPAMEEPLVRLTLTARPGSVITGIGAPPLRVDSSGTAFRMLPAAREYTVRTSLAGYSPVTQKIFLSTDRELAVEQKKPSPWGLDVSLSDSRAPGLGVTMTLSDPAIFVRLGVVTYAFALALSTTEVFLSEPLTNVDFRAGMYLSPADRVFRFYVGLGAFLRVVHAKDVPVMIEPVAPGGFQVLVGTEVPILTRGRVYFEYTPSMYLSGLPDALRASVSPDKDAPGWVFTDLGGLNFLSFRFGIRWPL